MLAFIGERIGHYRRGGFTYPSRMAGNARSRLPPWKTRSSRGRRLRCSSAIYEEDFLGFSYGFRPGRGPHDAMDALVGRDHQHKGELDTGRRHPLVLRHGQPGVADQSLWNIAIGDRRIIRLIQKWLKAGVLEDGIVTVSDKGTGQGSVISPLLANLYLHYVSISGPNAGDGVRLRAI